MTRSDEEVLAAAAQQLRHLVPDRPPLPSRELALLLADGVPARVGPLGRLRAVGTRIAGLGLLAKLTLAAGVAVAGVGGAATAVELSHGSGGHSRDLPRHDPRGLVTPSPATTPSATPSDDHGGDDSTGDDRGGDDQGGDDRGGSTPGSDDGGGTSSGGGSDDGSNSGSSGSGSDDGSTSGGSTSGGSDSGSNSGSGSGSGSDGGSTSGGSDSGSGSGSDDSTSGH